MTKKVLAPVVAALVLNLVCATSPSAKPTVDKEAQFAAKVKAGIFKLGTGPAARVEIKLRDGTKLKGYVAEASEDHFIVVDKTGASTEVPYPQVRQANGNNLSTAAKFAVAAAVFVGLAIVVAHAVRSK